MDHQFIRAKSQENKNIRMQQIMDVTDQLFHEKTYHEITLSLISQKVNLARGGLYKYVSSKEEIFLRIYLQKQQQLLDDIVNGLKNKKINLNLLAKTMSQNLYKHLDFIKYHQILNAIIETNVSIEKLAQFKKTSNQQQKQLFDIIMNIGHFNEQQSFDIYLTILYHSVYLYDRVAYHDTYVQAMELAGLKIINIDFVENMIHFIEMVFTNY
jgi:AcrR family transcriptional regulator